MAAGASNVRHRMKPPSNVVYRWIGQSLDVDGEAGAAGGDRRAQQVDERCPPGELRLRDHAGDIAAGELAFGEHGGEQAARLLRHQLVGAVLVEPQEGHAVRGRIVDAVDRGDAGVEVGQIGGDVALDQLVSEIRLVRSVPTCPTSRSSADAVAPTPATSPPCGAWADRRPALHP